MPGLMSRSKVSKATQDIVDSVFKFTDSQDSDLEDILKYKVNITSKYQ